MSERYYSWAQVQERIMATAKRVQEKYDPTMLVPVAEGGLIPARLMQSSLKQLSTVADALPIHCIRMEITQDPASSHGAPLVCRLQWLDRAASLSGQRLLLVDQVDNTRQTLSCAVAELTKFLDEMEADFCKASGAHTPSSSTSGGGGAVGGGTWVRPSMAIFVLHNKRRPKMGELPTDLLLDRYFSAEDTEDRRHVYPWDAQDVEEHTHVAEQQAAEERARLDAVGHIVAPSATGGTAGDGGARSPTASLQEFLALQRSKATSPVGVPRISGANLVLPLHTVGSPCCHTALAAV